MPYTLSISLGDRHDSFFRMGAAVQQRKILFYTVIAKDVKIYKTISEFVLLYVLSTKLCIYESNNDNIVFCYKGQIRYLDTYSRQITVINSENY